MTKYILAGLAALALIVAVPTASATEIVGLDAPAIQLWANEAKMPTPPGNVEIRGIEDDATCSDEWACALPGVIYIDAAVPLHDLRPAFLHEMGHEFDFELLTESERSEFTELAGVPGRPWDFEIPGVDIHKTSPREYFAEAFGLCSEYGLHIDPDERFEALPLYIGRFVSQHRYERICTLILRASEGHGTGPVPG